MANTIIYDISFLSFLITYSFLLIFLIIRYRKTQKLARPFILSLILYFLFDTIAITFIYNYYKRINFDPLTADPTAALLLLFYGIFVVFGPLNLIFILEKQIVNKEILKNKHLITMIQISLFGFGILIIFGTAGQDPTTATTGSTIGIVIILLIICLQVMFFLSGFLYLSVKSTGEYRRNTILVFIGYLGQFIVNTISFFSIGNPTATVDEKFNIAGLFLFLRVIPMIIMAYGFLKLYGKKKKEF